MNVEPLGLADVVDRDDVRVVDLRHRARLAHEPLGQRRVVAAQQLERDLAAELGILGAPHDAHRAGAEPLERRCSGRTACRAQRPRCGRAIADVERWIVGVVGRAPSSRSSVDRRGRATRRHRCRSVVAPSRSVSCAASRAATPSSSRQSSQPSRCPQHGGPRTPRRARPTSGPARRSRRGTPSARHCDTMTCRHGPSTRVDAARSRRPGSPAPLARPPSLARVGRPCSTTARAAWPTRRRSTTTSSPQFVGERLDRRATLASALAAAPAARSRARRCVRRAGADRARRVRSRARRGRCRRRVDRRDRRISRRGQAAAARAAARREGRQAARRSPAIAARARCAAGCGSPRRAS